MKVGLLGGTGYIGSEVLKVLLDKNYEVRALVRNISKFPKIDSVNLIEGDFKDLQRLDEFVSGLDVIIYTLNPDKDASLKENNVQYLAAFAHLVESAASKGSKIIALSGASVPLPKENSIPFKRKLIRSLMKMMIGKNVAVKDEEAKMLNQSTLNWVIVRPGMVKKEKLGTFKVALDNLPSSSVDRGQLAKFIVDCVSDSQYDLSGPLVGTSK